MAAAGGQGEDAELQELLESALDDFDKTIPPPPPPPPDTAETEKTPGGPSTEPLFASQERFFHELFDTELATQASDEFEKAMRELADQEPQLVEQFHKLSEIAAKVGSDPVTQQEFTSCLQQTLTGLAKNANDLQQSPEISEDVLSHAMDGLGLAEGAGDAEESFVPIMQTIMQNLLSKDVLYPSLKEIADKYPDWLDAHRDTLPAVELRKYERQHAVMGRICQQLEAEAPGEADGQQKARFEAIVDLMQQLQDLGEPPKELADVAPGLNFEMDGMNLPENAALTGEQCTVM